MAGEHVQYVQGDIGKGRSCRTVKLCERSPQKLTLADCCDPAATQPLTQVGAKNNHGTIILLHNRLIKQA